MLLLLLFICESCPLRRTVGRMMLRSSSSSKSSPSPAGFMSLCSSLCYQQSSRSRLHLARLRSRLWICHPNQHTSNDNQLGPEAKSSRLCWKFAVSSQAEKTQRYHHVVLFVRSGSGHCSKAYRKESPWLIESSYIQRWPAHNHCFCFDHCPGDCPVRRKVRHRLVGHHSTMASEAD